MGVSEGVKSAVGRACAVKKTGSSAVQEVRARKVLREGRVGSSHTCLDNVFAYMRPRACFQKLSPVWLMLTLAESKENI